MGLLYDLYRRNKKVCKDCGCIMYEDVEADFCEVCTAEREGTIPDSLRERRVTIDRYDI